MALALDEAHPVIETNSWVDAEHETPRASQRHVVPVCQKTECGSTSRPFDTTSIVGAGCQEVRAWATCFGWSVAHESPYRVPQDDPLLASHRFVTGTLESSMETLV